MFGIVPNGIGSDHRTGSAASGTSNPPNSAGMVRTRSATRLSNGGVARSARTSKESAAFRRPEGDYLLALTLLCALSTSICARLDMASGLAWSALLTGLLSVTLLVTATTDSTTGRSAPSIAEGRVLCCTTVIATLASTMTAMSCGHTWLACSAVCTGTLSINYWRKPAWGLRRDADLTAAFTFMSVHVFLCSFWCEQRASVIACYAVGTSFFAVATTTWAWQWSYWHWAHATFHLTATLGNCLLYRELMESGSFF
jgi:hypothetical protein